MRTSSRGFSVGAPLGLGKVTTGKKILLNPKQGWPLDPKCP